MRQRFPLQLTRPSASFFTSLRSAPYCAALETLFLVLPFRQNPYVYVFQGLMTRRLAASKGAVSREAMIKLREDAIAAM
jgi:hypothetical protein